MAVHSFLARRVLRRARPFGAAVDPRAADDLEAFLARLLRSDGTGDLSETAFDPRVVVSEGPDELLLAAELPGFGRDDVEVIVDGDDVTLRAHDRTRAAKTSAGCAHGEPAGRSFSRTFRIPFEVEAEDVRCRLRDGLLTVAVARPTEAKTRARTVPVTTA